MRSCIFIDSENLRYSIIDLFPYPLFNKDDYFPKIAKWEGLFNKIAKDANTDRLRTYWYVVNEIEFYPFNLKRFIRDGKFTDLKKILNENYEDRIKKSLKPDDEMKSIVTELDNKRSSVESQFKGWKVLQDGIASTHEAVEFRRTGRIRYDLFKNRFVPYSEKSVDVKLATDLLYLKDIYDVAIILSGDQDYVPAVERIKDSGKKAINVYFEKADGTLLPGGAPRLNQICDSAIRLTYDEMKKYMAL